MRLGLFFTITVEEFLKTSEASDLKTLRKTVDELLALPEKEGAQEVRRIENEIDIRRDYAMNDMPAYKCGTEYVNAALSTEQVIWNLFVHNYLMNLESRDLASAILCSLNSEFVGSHDIFVADDKNMLGIKSVKLASLLYPGAKVDIQRLNGFDALVDYRPAEKIIGFRAKHSIADYYKELYG